MAQGKVPSPTIWKFLKICYKNTLNNENQLPRQKFSAGERLVILF